MMGRVSLRDYSYVFFNLIKSDKRILIVVALYGLVASLFNITLPLSIQYISGQIVANASVLPIFVITFCLIFFLAFYVLLKLIQIVAFSYFEKIFFINKSNKIISIYLNNKNSLKQNEVLMSYSEVFSLIQYLGNFIFSTTLLIQQFFIGLVITAFYHISFLFFNIFLFFTVMLVFKFFLPRSIMLCRREYDIRYQIGSLIQKDSIYQNEEKHLQSMLAEYYKRKTNYFNIIFSQNIIFLILYIFATAIFLLTSGYLALKGYITIPQFLASEVIFSLTFATFGDFTKNLKNIYDMLNSSKKISDCFLGIDDDFVCDGSKGAFPNFYKKLLKIVFLFVLLLILALFIVPWYQTSKGNGKIIAYNQEDRVQDITAMVGGRIVKWYAKDGAFVKKNDNIAEISDNDPELILKLESELNAVKSQLKDMSLTTQTLMLNYQRQSDLYKKGLTSRKDFEKAKIEYQKNSAYEKEIKVKLIQTEVKLARQRSQLVVAPKDGYLLNSQSKSASSYVYPGEVIAKFVPKITKPVIEIFVKPIDVPLIHEGRKVRIQIEGWPALRIPGWPSTSLGTFGGIVNVVDGALSDNGMFRVFVTPDPNDSPWPDMKYIKQGTRVIAWITMNRVSLGYEMWRQLNGFPMEPDSYLFLKNHDEKNNKK